MISDKDLILIPDGTNHNYSLPVITCLKQLAGARIHIMSMESRSILRFSRYCDGYHYTGGATDEERARDLLALTKRLGATIVFPICEEGIRIVQGRWDLFKDYRVPRLPSLEQIGIAGDKGRLALFLAEHGIDSPKTVLYEPGNESSVHELEGVFPVLFKPVDGAGGEGIMRFERPEDLYAFLDHQRDSLPRAIIQEFIDGYDIDCSVLCVDGRIHAYTIQRPIHLDKGYGFSRTIRFLHDPGALETASQLMEKLRWNGVAHVDMRYCSSRKKTCVIEINPRYWGTLMGSMVAGVNFPHLALLEMQGIPFDAPIYHCDPFLTLGAWSRIRFGKYSPALDMPILLSNTDARWLLADPLPNIARIISRLFKRFFI